MTALAACQTLADFETLFPPRTLKAGAEVTRIAPSPTGMPHIGTAMQAILDRAIADKTGGIFMLRIEDTDRARTVPGAVEAILDGLKWINMVPDEGPSFGGAYGPYTQSERLHLYQVAAKHLVEKGHAYHCFCTEERIDLVRKTQAAQHQTPMYDRHCRALAKDEVAARLAKGERNVVRMAVPNDVEKITVTDEVRGEIVFGTATIDDSIILKTDGFPTYHLASVVDDHFMRVTTVVRGEEWIPSTPKHYILYDAFGWQKPRFLHTVLLRDAQKRKLSKRSGDTSIAWFRRQGFLPEGFRNFLTRVMWVHPEDKDIYPFEDFRDLLNPKNLASTGPVADMDLLQFINGRYITDITDQARAELLQQYLDYLVTTGQGASNTIDPEAEAEETTPEQVLALKKAVGQDFTYTVKAMSVEPGRYHRLADIVFNAGYFYDALYTAPGAAQLEKLCPADVTRAILDKFQEGFGAGIPPAETEALMKKTVQDLGLKDKQVFMTLRLALTGRERTPPVPEIAAVLGAVRVAARLDATRNALNGRVAA